MYRWIALLAVFALSLQAGAAEFAPKQQKQLDKTARQILTALENKSQPAFTRLFDVKAVRARSVDLPGLSKANRKAALEAMKVLLAGQFMMAARYNGMSAFELVHVGPSQTGALVTIKGLAEGRTTYWEFHLAEGRRGKFKIVDWLGLDSGVSLTESLLVGYAQDARNTDALVAALSAEVADADRPALAKYLGLLADKWDGHDVFPDFIAAYYELPAYLQKERILLRQWGITALISDANDEYMDSLKQLEKHHGDNWRACEQLLIYYEHIGDEQGTQRCTEALSSNYTLAQ